jgi:hypothetical protein
VLGNRYCTSFENINKAIEKNLTEGRNSVIFLKANFKKKMNRINRQISRNHLLSFLTDSTDYRKDNPTMRELVNSIFFFEKGKIQHTVH